MRKNFPATIDLAPRGLPSPGFRAFTIVEVVAAIGIFTTAVFLTVALLSGSAQSEVVILDQVAARQIVATINAKLDSLGYAVVQGTQDSDLSNSYIPSGLLYDANTVLKDVAADDDKLLYVSRLGDKIGVYKDPLWGRSGPDSDEKKYFEVMLLRTPDERQSPRKDGSVAQDALLAAPSVVFTVRVSWPAFQSDGTKSVKTDRAQRGVFIFNSALAR